MQSVLSLVNLTISIDAQSIIQNLNLSVAPGSVHVIMGPNGSGKSSLANCISGDPRYSLAQDGDIRFADQSIIALSPDKRARLGIFVSFQYAQEIPGIPLMTFLHEAHRACTGENLDLRVFQERVKEYARLVGLREELLSRTLNDRFSGGEKKRFELVQLLLLKPKIAILDEIDSGLDVDGLRTIAQALQFARQENPSMSIILITHYNRLVSFIKPDVVHIMIQGKLVTSGDAQLAHTIDQNGYESYAQR